MGELEEKKKKKKSKRREKSITARHYCLRIQSDIQLLSSLRPSLLQTPMSGIVTISNSEGLTFNILSCQGLWNRWHISISSSLRQTGRIQAQHASIFDLGLLVKRKITNDTNNCVWCKLLFIFYFLFLCHNWIKLINRFFFLSPRRFIWTCLTLKTWPRSLFSKRGPADYSRWIWEKPQRFPENGTTVPYSASRQCDRQKDSLDDKACYHPVFSAFCNHYSPAVIAHQRCQAV